MNLRPDKVKGVVLIDKVDYHNAMNQLFSDKTQFKIIKNDLTLTLKTVQNYLNNLCKRNNISEGEKKQMIPISAQLSHVHGLPKIPKVFANILKLCSIMTQPTRHTAKLYNICCAPLLKPLITINNYTLKDSCDAANKIKSVPSETFEEGYQFMSFDVEFLYTNVPLKKTINFVGKVTKNKF